MREVLFNLVIIVGVCKPLEEVFDIDAAVEREEDRDFTATRYDVPLPALPFLSHACFSS